MELSESSTQPSSQHRAILVNSQGIPLKVNLQAVELEGRPKLVRTLKNAGALVASNAKEAAIILVDSTTESGKRLIRTWGHDASKVVLEYTWARASIGAGRPLLEADNWGGTMTIDDGKPVTIDGVVVDEDELQDVEAFVTKSPLPTPRVTPVDSTSRRAINTVVDRLGTTRSESGTSAPCTTRLQPSGHLVAQPAVVGAIAEEPVASTHDMPSPHSPPPPPPPATQSLPYSQPTLFMQPSQSQNTYAYAPFPTQQAHPSQPQVMSTQPFLHGGFPSSQPQMVDAPGAVRTSLVPVQSQMMQMAPNTVPVNDVNPQAPNLATLMTIMEIVRHMDQASRLGQNQPSVSQLPANPNIPALSVQTLATPGTAPSTSAFQATRAFESPSVDATLSNSQDHLSDPAIPSWNCGSSIEVSEGPSMTQNTRLSRRPPDEILTPSISRKRPSAIKPINPPPKRSRKGKARAASIDSSEASEIDELMEVSDSSDPTRSSASSPARTRKIIAHKKDGDIFLSGSGQPLRFFVQVDLHGRHTVVTNIKKNRGKIVNNIADADYLILFARSDTFQGLLNEAIALGKSPVLAAFVADCVEEGALLDETDYILDSVAKVKPLKRGRQSTFSTKAETPETVSHQAKVVKPKSSTTTGTSKKSKGTPSKPSTDENLKEPNPAPPGPAVRRRGDSMSPRSPTPPPVTTRQLMRSGKYLFTEVEDEYFLRFAKHHLSRDPTISNTALIHKLHKKMPHHTSASWAVHVEKKVKGALEDIRKRANIANRKRVNGAVNQSLSQRSANEGTSSRDSVVSTAKGDDGISLNPSQPSQEDLEQQDFNVITHFFASGGGDDDDDERVWRELEKHQRCRSANSWPDYYAAHEKRVYVRIEELMNERAGQ